jgi:hypothetical protein
MPKKFTDKDYGVPGLYPTRHLLSVAGPKGTDNMVRTTLLQGCDLDEE